MAELNIAEMDEGQLAKIIAQKRNLPYTIKIERIDGDKIYIRNSWGNHLVYIHKDNDFFTENEL
jgi:hypothetical protein